MSGEWIYREADQHKCQFPKVTPAATTGDLWRCNVCDVIWKVTVHDSQFDGVWGDWSLPTVEDQRKLQP